MNRNYSYYVGDFETTIYTGQTETRVWAAAVVPLYSENVEIFTNIRDTFDYLVSLKCNIVIYYHNLKFDGHFWIDYFLRTTMTQAIDNDNHFIDDKNMVKNSYKYVISNYGQWYEITIMTKFRKLIKIRDSLKLLPFSVKKLSREFETKHHKTDIEYTGNRLPGQISADEIEYIKNDVLVVKESLEKMFQNGNDRMTIGACCFADFKSQFEKHTYWELFPNLKDFKIKEDIYGAPDADAYIRKSYRGGWCYLKPEYAGKILQKGYTLDVNSLYPSVMLSECYPVGLPTFFVGEIPEKIKGNPNYYYFVRIQCKFELRKNFLPTIQIKNNWFYKSNEYLTTSKIFNPNDGRYYDRYVDIDGTEKDATVELTMTMSDFELFKKHYYTDIKILDGCYFFTHPSIFIKYINKYRYQKINAKNSVERTIAKLFSNNLYGKMATGSNNSYKLCYLDEIENKIKFKNVFSDDRTPVYIPCGSAITSYARNFTISAAQANYDAFVYSDTDSIHCLGDVKDVKNCKIDDKEYSCWKLENVWDTGLFVRQKTYIEITGNEWDIKCAGMPEHCKQLFYASCTGDFSSLELKKLEPDELDFINMKRDITDFKIGLEVPGKLKQQRIPGGVILKSEKYIMRD